MSLLRRGYGRAGARSSFSRMTYWVGLVALYGSGPIRLRARPAPPHAPPFSSISRGFLKIEWAAGLRSECMELRRTLRAVLERSEQKSRKVYCSCKEVANGSLLPI